MVLHTRGRVGSRRFSRRRDPVRNSRVSLLLFIFFGQGCLQGGFLAWLALLVFLVFLDILVLLVLLANLVLGNPRRSKLI